MNAAAQLPSIVPADPDRQAAKALTALRVARRAALRARRRDRPWDERIYPWYVTILVVGYLALLLAGTPNVRIGRDRIAATAAGAAATACVGDLLALLALATIGGAVSAAVYAGPVVLWPEDARVLLPTPVSRATLLRRRLLAAYLRAFALAGLTSGVLILVEVALLSQPAAHALPGAIAFPALVAVTAVAAGWLVQAVPALRGVARLMSTVSVLILAAVGLAIAVELGSGGQLAGWAQLHRLGRLPVVSFVTDATQPGTSGARLALRLLVFAAVALALVVVGWQRATRVSAEQVVIRAGRAVAVRTALRLGYTSSAYVVRTGPARRARTRRRYLRVPGSYGPLLSKSALQEQGAWIPGRIALAGSTVVVLEAALFCHVTVTTATPDLVGGLLAGIVFTAVATRYADALRIDVELATPATSLPASFRQLAAADLAIPAGVFAIGGVLAAPLLGALGLQPWKDVPVLAVFGLLLGAAAAAIAALSATGNNPSPFLPASAAAAIRARGLIASIMLMLTVTAVRHPPAFHGLAPLHTTAFAAVTALAIFDAILVALALWAGKNALLAAR
jgi:hypothetical protein